jgi:hypothetical protein
VGFAQKFPPHYISPLSPTGAILFSVLVVTPIRHWWAYSFAAYFTSVVNDARAAFSVSAIFTLPICTSGSPSITSAVGM